MRGQLGTGIAVMALAVAFSLVGGCGGGGGDDAEDEDFDHDATGIWSGTHTPDGKTGVSVSAVVAPNGRFVAISSQIYLSGTGSVSGDTFSANATGFKASGTFPSGSAQGSFTLAGMVFEENRIDSSYSGAGESGRLVMTYDSGRSRRPSSLSTVAGSYTTPSGASSIAINSNGSMTFNSTQGTNCIGNGTISVRDGTRNVYTWTMTLSGCTGVNGNVDGVAYLDDDGGKTNNRIVMLGSGTSAPFGVIAVKPG
jgi:hypothetical protein